MGEQLGKTFFFLFAITLNALGNSFMIISSFGSAPWTSAGENLDAILPFSIGVCIIILHLLALFLSYLMKEKITPVVVVQSMALAMMFGLLIDVFLYLHELVYVPESLVIRLLYLIIGLNLVALGVAIYFHSSSIYLPTDFLLKAFGKRLKSYTRGTIVWTMIPLSIGLAISLYRGQIIGIGMGTLFFMFGMGYLIDQYNTLIQKRKQKEPTSS